MIEDILSAGNKPLVGTNNLKASAQATTSAAVIIQNYVGTILTQPDLSLPDVLPQLPDHQKVAREHAVDWRDNVQPLAIKTNADLVNFANSFDAYYDPLMQLAVKIQHSPDDKGSIATFKAGVRQLQTIVTEKHTETKKVIASLSDFQSHLAEDARSFGSDFNKAESVLAGKDGQIAALGKQIDAIHSAMNKDLTMIAAGSTAAVVGGLAIAVGVLAEIETAGASTALIVGGIAIVGAGAGVAIAGGVDYSKQSNALGAVIAKQEALQQQYAATKLVNNVVQGLSEQASSAVVAAGSLLAGWQTLGQDFVEFEGALDRADPDLGYFLIAQLDAAKKDWDDLAAQARKLEDYGDLPVKDSKANEPGKMDPAAVLAALAA